MGLATQRGTPLRPDPPQAARVDRRRWTFAHFATCRLTGKGSYSGQSFSLTGKTPMTAHLQVVTPSNVNRSVPVRPANAELRTREYLTPKEVEKLIATARRSARYGNRDATLILVAFRHGLRASEICDLEWSQVEFSRTPTLHVRRAKNGKPAAHPIRGDELRAHFVSYSGNSPTRLTCSPPSAAARSRRMPSIDSSSASASGPDSPSWSMRTCCAMPAATRLPMPAMTPGRCRTG